MYVAVQHRIKDAEAASARGQKLIEGEGAPPGAQVLQFIPSRDRSAVNCIWEASSLEDVQDYVDATLGEASANSCFEVDSEQAFATELSGIGAGATAA